MCLIFMTGCKQQGSSSNPGSLEFGSIGSDTSNTHSNPKASSNTVPKYVRFTKHEIMDPEGTGIVAFTCLLPEGWTVNDKLYWEYQDATLPIRYKADMQNADGTMQIHSYPDVRAVQSSGPTGTSGYPPPTGILPGLKDFIRQQRKGIQYQVLEEKMIRQIGPQTSYVQGSPMVSTSQNGFVKIGYTQNGTPMEEEFLGQLDISQMSSQGYASLSSTVWAASGLYSCSAPKGKLEDCQRMALTIKSSSRPTLEFYNKFIQVTQLLSDAVYARIYQAGQISRIISQTNDQISKTISDSYWQSQKTYEGINNQYSDALRGVDRYQDGRYEIQLPSGYSNAWVNDQGEYLLGEASNFDPNTTLTGNWKQLNKQQ